MSSVFDAPTTEQVADTTAQTIETNQEQNTTEDWVQNVVQSKGEQWADPQVLAKGYAHAQKRIQELEAKAEQYAEQDYAKNLLEQLQKQQAPEAATQAAPEAPIAETVDQTNLRPEDIESLLNKTLLEREAIAKVDKTLRDRFGDAANTVVHQKAKELGLSIDRMQELSKEAPDAFLAMIGGPVKTENNNVPSPSVNTQSSNFNKGTQRNWAYYNKLRKENPNMYNTPQVQQQMFQDRVALGAAFNS